MTRYVSRELAATLKAALKDMPVVVITGMRQTGKSTLLKMEPGLRERRYFTFDDFAHLAAAKEDPESFVDSEDPITIDEVHKCPEVLTAIKAAVDRNRKPGRFLLSGSANFLMLKNISESLAGRAVYFNLLPFTRRELSGNIRKKPFLYRFMERRKLPGNFQPKRITEEEVLTGGMPSVCLGEVKDKSLWFKGYEQTYLERDLRELSQVGNIISFRRLLHLAALRTGQLLSPSQLGRDSGLNAATASRYLSLLEASFIVYRVSPYLRNRASRLIKSSKLFMSDSGLACHLAGIKGFQSGFGETLWGAMFETYVAQNLAGILSAAWPEAELYFWNVQGRHEVDFVIEAGGSCLAVEVKSGRRWTERDLSALKAFIEAAPHCEAAIMAYNGTEAVRLGKKLFAIPLSLVLS